MQPVSNLRWYILIIILVAILVPSLTWNVLTASSNKNPFSKPSSGNGTETVSSFFDFQNIGVTGKVTKVDGNKIWIENQKGEMFETTMAANFISSDSAPQGIPGASQSPASVRLNETAIISFLPINGVMQAVNIAYILRQISAPQNQDSTSSAQPLKLDGPMGIQPETYSPSIVPAPKSDPEDK